MNLPNRVELNADAMILHWPGGAAQRIAHRTLRNACPCAGCRRVRIAGGETAHAKDVVVTTIQPMGYGVQLVFSDGHDRGIFPWLYLQALPEIASTVAAAALTA
ncbi:gamma-butyrobetaine hydroxylase-like domain-containing protein [Paraburkholderia bryophila]|uniref:DUF971 family protein n=1 Tax=Paraburkholderia bryophila TaxID=420952 RepID=A0A7Y9WHE5_9BURK|nr:gamma-butyrobetaine hydroxylase-like domain-containing protein [Paraburkholderia bryophila]NYH20920.1 DUF971 family protein [Paraburkholderia bryophila]